MRVANVTGRLSILLGEDWVVDVENCSGGRWPSDPQAVFDHWAEFLDWAAGTGLDERYVAGEPHAGDAWRSPLLAEQLEAPVPRPRQVFAIGLNYAAHADETNLTTPPVPSVFTKFPSSICGPDAFVALPGDQIDWEVELVVVIGAPAHRVPRNRAWSHVAGLTVGQDLSDRHLQMLGDLPQFSLAKSYPGFAPTGPWLVTIDEVVDPDDVELKCTLNGEVVQLARSSAMIFDVPELIHRLSSVTRLEPGDLLFTGTPAGVGMGRSPQRYLAPGDELVSAIEGIGRIRTRLSSGGSLES